MLDLTLKLLLLPVLGYLTTRAFVAIAQAFGWHPEKQFQKYARAFAQRVRAVYRRCREGRPPVVKSTPGLVWHFMKNGKWQAEWHARDKKYPYKRLRLWQGTIEELGPMARKWLSEKCWDLEGDFEAWQKANTPSIEEIVASIRRIIADGPAAPPSAPQSTLRPSACTSSIDRATW